MNIEILNIPYEQKSILQHLLELYHYDFSENEEIVLNDERWNGSIQLFKSTRQSEDE